MEELDERDSISPIRIIGGSVWRVAWRAWMGHLVSIMEIVEQDVKNFSRVGIGDPLHLAPSGWRLFL